MALLVFFFCNLRQHLYQLRAEAWVEGIVYVVDGKELRRVFAQEQGEVKQKVEKALVSAALVELRDGISDEAVGDGDATLCELEIGGDAHAAEPVYEEEVLS